MRWPSWWCPGLPLLCFHDVLPLVLSSKTLALRLVRLNIAGSVLLQTSHVELVRLHAEDIYLSFNDRIISRIKTHHRLAGFPLTSQRSTRISCKIAKRSVFYLIFARLKSLRWSSWSRLIYTRFTHSTLPPSRLAVDQGSRRELYHRIARRYTRAHHGRSHADRT